MTRKKTCKICKDGKFCFNSNCKLEHCEECKENKWRENLNKEFNYEQWAGWTCKHCGKWVYLVSDYPDIEMNDHLKNNHRRKKKINLLKEIEN